MASLSDKSALMQVIGGLMKEPIMLLDDKFIFTTKDFDEPIANMAFQVINNLFSQYKPETITIVDIDNYLQQYADTYAIFSKNNGVQYLKDCLDIVNLSNFKYYYDKMKKLSALRILKRDGFNIKELLDENEVNLAKEKKQLEKLDAMSVEEIFDFFIANLNDLTCDYIIKNDTEEGEICSGVEEVFASLEETPEIGYPLQGNIYNTIVRGARLKKFYINSSNSGGGKSRGMVGDACNIAYPEKYNHETKSWEIFGEGRKVLYFTTEMEKDEIQTMILAFLSNVNEDKILRNAYDDIEEKNRVVRAIELMKQYKENFIFVRVADPSISQVKAMIRKEVLKHDIYYVFYDYIFSSPALVNEYRGTGLREDVVLLYLSTALKDLANELGIFMMSATQLADKWKDWKGIRDYGLVRGSRSIVDKTDAAAISLLVTDEEHTMVDVIAKKLNVRIPNYVKDVYKVRRGKYNKVRIWSFFDFGTCRLYDLFLTDANYNLIDIVCDMYVENQQQATSQKIQSLLLEKEMEGIKPITNYHGQEEDVEEAKINNIIESTQEEEETVEEKKEDWSSLI